MLSLVLTIARAQPQQNVSAGGIPEKAPGGWKQSEWETVRNHCLQLSAEAVARQRMTPDQLKGVQPFSMRDLEDMEACEHMVEPPPAPASTSTGGTSITMPPPPPPPPPAPSHS